MKNVLLSTIALLSCIAQADVVLHLNFEHKNQEVVRNRSLDCIVEYNNVTRITADNLEVTVVATALENGWVELAFTIIYKNNDGSYELVCEPVIKTEYGKEAELSIENDAQDVFSLKVIAHQQDAA